MVVRPAESLQHLGRCTEKAQGGSAASGWRGILRSRGIGPPLRAFSKANGCSLADFPVSSGAEYPQPR